ncbi:MAG: hypothetical protein HY826_00375 [Actinobacteria bacterium]|nr:hypothetical protein [Actinomycetota bacterium]
MAWVEGGRLIVVTGPDDVAATLALAESVRPATTDEWAEVTALAQRQIDVPDSTNVVFGGGVKLYTGVDEATGETFSFSAGVFDGDLTTCIEEQSSATCSTSPNDTVQLPLLWVGNRVGLRLVLAVVDAAVADEPELRITLADGTVSTFPLEDVGPSLPGPAVATQLPADHGAVELWIGGKVVASL